MSVTATRGAASASVFCKAGVEATPRRPSRGEGMNSAAQRALRQKTRDASSARRIRARGNEGVRPDGRGKIAPRRQGQGGGAG